MRHDLYVRLAELRRRRSMLNAVISLLEEYQRANAPAKRPKCQPTKR